MILRYLREIDRKVDLMRADISDLKSRMTALEAQIATVNGRLDRVEMRLDRIERFARNRQSFLLTDLDA